MTMKRMRHPLHGFHHPLSGGEEATMRANGWVDDEPTPEVAPDLKPIEPAADPAPAKRKAKA